jgi:Ca2+-binding RTX toxin-like protein
MRKTVLLLALVCAAAFALAGAAFAESIGCPGGGRCVGTAGNDTMRGGNGNDRMVGGGGKDRMYGGARDIFDCGSGTDTAYFVQGQDSVRNCEVLNPPE